MIARGGDSPAAAIDDASATTCAVGAPEPVLLLACEAMRTRFELVLPDDGRGAAALRAVGEAALAEIVGLGETLSRFRRDGVVRHLERTAPGGWTRVDCELFALLSLCAQVCRLSDGLFDVTLGSLMRTHGFHGSRDGGPDDHGVVGLEHANCSAGFTAGVTTRTTTSCDAIEFDPVACAVRFPRPLELDLGGVAKGFALDRAALILREHGIRSALIHGGTSSIIAIGSPPNAQGEAGGQAAGGWSIAIASPVGNRRLLLRDAALAVSAPHGRMVDGRPHVIDPRRSAPAVDAADVVAIHIPLADDPAALPAASADAWTKPALLESRRPAHLPPGASAFIVHQGRTSLDELPIALWA